jgi:hypothetical protein
MPSKSLLEVRPIWELLFLETNEHFLSTTITHALSLSGHPIR